MLHNVSVSFLPSFAEGQVGRLIKKTALFLPEEKNGIILRQHCNCRYVVIIYIMSIS
jgi:hypothetical protein